MKLRPPEKENEEAKKLREESLRRAIEKYGKSHRVINEEGDGR